MIWLVACAQPPAPLAVAGRAPVVVDAPEPDAEAASLRFTQSAADAGLAVRQSDDDPFVAGGAAADLDGDGDTDVFVVSGGKLGKPDRLFWNQGDGTFVEGGAAAGIAVVHRGRAAAVADVDGDGWLDVFVSSGGPVEGAAAGYNRLWHNQGDGTFVDVAGWAGVAETSALPNGAAFGDYDRDGDLDLFVTGYEPAREGAHLLRNDGGLVFTDVTEATGLFRGPAGDENGGFSARFADMDGDLWPELLYVADYRHSRYFRNAGGALVDETAASGTSREGNGMGHTVADLDGDGLLDWFVTSIYNGTYHTGNKAYRNLGGHRYEEIAASVGVADGGWAWGTVSADLDHDGRLDLFAVNGVRSPGYADQPPRLWLARGDGFSEQAVAAGFTPSEGRGVLDLDADGDGDRDLIVLQHDGPLQLWRNEVSGPNARWLQIRLDTTGDPGLPPGGVGARLVARCGEHERVRYVAAGDNYASHSDPTVHFGLGEAEVVEELVVYWPDGTATTLWDVAADQLVTVAP